MEAMADSLALRSQPVYSIAEAARYLSIPASTLRLWTLSSQVNSSANATAPILTLPTPTDPQLSFLNLVEAHVLRVLRTSHRVPLYKVRMALDYINYQFGVDHPLARIEFQTDGVDLFVESIGRLINTSQSGQLTLQSTVQRLLERVEVDESGLAARLYPLTPGSTLRSKPVVIDPAILAGRPVISGTALSTTRVFEQYQQGISMDDLTRALNCDRNLIEDAILCELLWLSQRS